VAYISNDSDRRVLVSSSGTPSDSQSWSGDTQVQGQSSAGDPALAVFDNTLWVAFISNDDNRKVLVCSSKTPSNSQSWSGNTEVQGQSSATNPSLAVFDNKPWVAFVSNDGNT
jgi:hypothetical protein